MQPKTASIPHIVAVAGAASPPRRLLYLRPLKRVVAGVKTERRATKCRGSYRDFIDAVEFSKDSTKLFIMLESFQNPNYILKKVKRSNVF